MRLGRKALQGRGRLTVRPKTSKSFWLGHHGGRTAGQGSALKHLFSGSSNSVPVTFKIQVDPKVTESGILGSLDPLDRFWRGPNSATKIA